MSSTDILLADIEAFIARTGMTPTEFGVQALNDPAFMIRLRAGSDIRMRTADRVRQFMAGHKSKASNKRQKKANQGSRVAA